MNLLNTHTKEEFVSMSSSVFFMERHLQSSFIVKREKVSKISVKVVHMTCVHAKYILKS